MVAAIVLVDLDDTLFQTARKCPAAVNASDLTPYGWTAAGEAISFATPPQVALIDWLQESTRLVVVTARSGDALSRTRMDFDLAVVAHGGGIVDHHPNSPPPERRFAADWRAIMSKRVVEAALEEVLEHVRSESARLRMGVRASIVGEAGLPLYVVVKHELPDGNDPELHAVCAGPITNLAPGWSAHVNGNNVAIMPPGLGKAFAVEWLLPELKAEHPSLPVIGIGDSFTDAGFMRLCDFAMTPTHSQLATRLFPASGR